MQLFDKILIYWPVLAASLLFLLLGLFWHLRSARAMELSPKPISWVRNYRSPGNSYRRELLGSPRPAWFLLLGLCAGLALLALFQVVRTSMVAYAAPFTLLRLRYGVFSCLLYFLGALAVFFLLELLFDSGYTALLGALLFAASPVRGHGECCLLAMLLLLLLLWLRAEKPSLPAELLYFGACLMMAPILALRPALVWLLPLLLCFHWYKLLRQRREGQLSGGGLALRLLLALLVWALTFLLAVLLLRFLNLGFQLRAFRALLRPELLLASARSLLQQLLVSFLKLPTRGMTLNLFLDAPLLGFGFWGCFAAWTMARARRSVRGSFPLIILGALLGLWLLTGRYALNLGLILSCGCILKNTDLGKRRALGLVMVLLGLCWYIAIQFAAWSLPLPAGLLERL